METIPKIINKKTTIKPIIEDKINIDIIPLPKTKNKKLITKTIIDDNIDLPIVNKGTGAGGANTNYFGKKFEEITNNETRLIKNEYKKTTFTKKVNDYYLSKIFDDKTIVFISQNGLKTYMKNKFNILLFRCPDEAYIIEYNTGKKVIKILEKKNQNVEGSVETKLWAGPSLKREYELILSEDWEVHYGFCVSKFLKKKINSNEVKYTVLNTILNENNIDVLFGDDENYFETLDDWINSFL